MIRSTVGRLSADCQPRSADNWALVSGLKKKKFVVEKINQASFVFIVTARVSRLKPHLSADQHEKNLVGRLSVLM